MRVMERSFVRLTALIALALGPAPALADDYVVLAAPSKDPGFRAAAEKLAAAHGAKVVALDPAAPEKVLPELKRLAPRHVALVLPPGDLDFAFQRRFLETATRLDDDPFVDFAFGYVTGATGADASAFVDACLAAGAKPVPAVLGALWGGNDSSLDRSGDYRFRTGRAPLVRCQVKGDEKTHDRAFLAGWLPRLARCTLLEFSGHGFPEQVVGGMDAADVKGLRLPGAVVLNVACWTGVTRTWFEETDGKLARLEVAPEKSLALALLRTGICGYTAYLGPRPAGPELDRDLVSLAADGDSLGDARRRDYDKTVLGFLGYGEERLRLERIEDGTRVRPGRDEVRDIMLEDATGGVVFGDPAVRPFVPRPGDDPIATKVERGEKAIVVTADCPHECIWLHLPDPTGRIGGETAMKVYERIPLRDLLVRDVVVDDVRVGEVRLASRVVWAVEEDHGERFVHVKVMFPRIGECPKDADLSLRFTVNAAASPASARKRGGSVEEPLRNGVK
jgi:hypothetical protein